MSLDPQIQSLIDAVNAQAATVAAIDAAVKQEVAYISQLTTNKVGTIWSPDDAKAIGEAITKISNSTTSLNNDTQSLSSSLPQPALATN
jgi:hypothetical protein